MSFPAVPRLVAIGDVHGDAAKAREALRLAGVMGAGDSWTGGQTVLVQVRGVVLRTEPTAYFKRPSWVLAAARHHLIHPCMRQCQSLMIAPDFILAPSALIPPLMPQPLLPACSPSLPLTPARSQVGDLLDRGGDEIEVVYLFEKLRREAKLAGGAVHVLLGNHETGNLEGWFRYATREGRRDFQRWAAWERTGMALRAACRGADVPADPLAALPHPHAGSTGTGTSSSGSGSGSGGGGGGDGWRADLRARAAALRPGSRMVRRFFAGNPTVVQVGSTVFVHGGLLPSHVTDIGLQEMNEQGRRWMLGLREGDGDGEVEGRQKIKDQARHNGRRATVSGGAPSSSHPSPPHPPSFFHSRYSPVWLRDYSLPDPSHCNCPALHHTLSLIPGAARLVMGHTIQQPGGISSACSHAAVRVDVGMARGCGDAPAEVLEIRGDRWLRVLTADGEPRWVGSQPEGREEEVQEVARAGAAVRVGKERGEEHVMQGCTETSSGRGRKGDYHTVLGLVPPSQT